MVEQIEKKKYSKDVEAFYDKLDREGRRWADLIPAREDVPGHLFPEDVNRVLDYADYIARRPDRRLLFLAHFVGRVTDHEPFEAFSARAETLLQEAKGLSGEGPVNMQEFLVSFASILSKGIVDGEPNEKPDWDKKKRVTRRKLSFWRGIVNQIEDEHSRDAVIRGMVAISAEAPMARAYALDLLLAKPVSGTKQQVEADVAWLKAVTDPETDQGQRIAALDGKVQKELARTIRQRENGFDFVMLSVPTLKSNVNAARPRISGCGSSVTVQHLDR